MTSTEQGFWYDMPSIFPSSDGNCSFLGAYPHRVYDRPVEWFKRDRQPYLVVDLVGYEWVTRACQPTLALARKYADGPNRWVVYPVDKNLF